MSDQNTPEPSPSATSRRRSSFAGVMDLFNTRSSTSNSPPNATSPYPGPITHAAAQAQQRRLSITTVGLGTSPSGNAPSASPFGSLRSRRQSVSSAGSGGSASVDESPFEEGEATAASSGGPPTSPFARRVSFGARALRDVRTGSGGSGGGGGNNANEGFNFAENMRARAQRTSISSVSPPNPGMHGRAKSVAVMEPPVRDIPAQARKPDHFQERILKGDFYMD